MSQIDRRAMLRWGLAAGASIPALDVLELFAQESKANEIEIDRKWYKRLPGDRTKCLICPLLCELNAGET